jgi:hypothetical protein
MAIRKGTIKVTYLYDDQADPEDQVSGYSAATILGEIDDGSMLGQVEYLGSEEVPAEEVTLWLLSMGNDGSFFDPV